MAELLERCAHPSVVLEAWNTTQARLSSEPVPRPEVEKFTANLLGNLALISASLADGTWQPGPLRRAEIPKSEGGIRVLHVPTLADRVAERALLAVLTPHVDPTLQPDSYGCRPGLGVNDAVRALQERLDDGDQWVVRTDVSSCFDTVSRRGCARAFADVVADPELLILVRRCLDRLPGQHGVAQGSPLSPLLVNVYLDQLDRELWAEGVSLIRFVDDVAASSASRADASEQLAAIRGAVERRGLTLSVDKTAVVRASEGIPFLGRVLRTGGSTQGPVLTDPSRVTLHITSRGSALRAKGTQFVVTDGRTRTLRHAARRTRMIVCNDRVLISSAAISLAARTGVEIAIVDRMNSVSAFLSAATARHAVRTAQDRALANHQRTLAIARAIVIGKIRNCEVLLSRTKARRLIVAPAVLEQLAHLRSRAGQMQSVPRLLGVEGSAARAYFGGLSAIFGPDWQFHAGNRRPPRDPVNAMLSYGYTVLAAEARRAVELAGFDPTRGFLHGPHRERPSLALDLMEEFRALIVDTTVLRLVGTRAVQLLGFTSGPAGCRMDLATRRALVTELERRLLTRVTHPLTHKPVSYRECLEEQALQLARLVTGGVPCYIPMPWR